MDNLTIEKLNKLNDVLNNYYHDDIPNHLINILYEVFVNKKLIKIFEQKSNNPEGVNNKICEEEYNEMFSEYLNEKDLYYYSGLSLYICNSNNYNIKFPMKYYFVNAIENNNYYAMYYLGSDIVNHIYLYQKTIDKTGEKYLKTAWKNGIVESYQIIADFYYKIHKPDINKKYHNKVLKKYPNNKKSLYSIYSLIRYNENITLYFDYINMLLKLADSIDDIIKVIKERFILEADHLYSADDNKDELNREINTYKFIYELYKSKVDLIDLHFNYEPNGEGCRQAKEDFLEKLKK